jgi:hypothetical protein
MTPTPGGARPYLRPTPREGTKQHQVPVMPRRLKGATVAQIAEVTSWQAHTVRGFFAGLKRRQGPAVEAAERVRQVGPGKEEPRVATPSTAPRRRADAAGAPRRRPAGDLISAGLSHRTGP